MWTRTNHRGEQVTLLEGPAYTVAAGIGAAAAPALPGRMRAAAAVATLGAGALGGYDDVAGSSGARGFVGHLGAFARGEITSGAIKLLGIGIMGIAAAALVSGDTTRTRMSNRGERLADIVVDGAVIAGSANMLNLFDLRPGRAIKVGLLAGLPVLATRGYSGAVAAAPVGAAAALLPEDVGERAMLGDAGANALGAALGVAAVMTLGRRGRLALLTGLAGLTAASEVVSFSRVIASVPPLRWLDELGRVDAPAPDHPAG